MNNKILDNKLHTINLTDNKYLLGQNCRGEHSSSGSEGITKKTKTKEAGITIIALVITIIILIILAGITIKLTIGQDGLFNRAKESQDIQRIAEIKEQLEITKMPVYIDNNGKLTKEQYFEELEREGIIENKNSFESLDNDLYSIITKDGYTVIMEIKENGVIIQDVSKNVSNKTKVADLEAKDYVWYEYTDKNGNIQKIKCIVLYDKDYNDTKETDYGVQIISEHIVGDEVTLGSDKSLAESTKSYNNAIDTLNKEAEKYLNTTYAKMARCAGSVPDNPYSESGDYNTSYTKLKNLKDSDRNYIADNEQLLGEKEVYLGSEENFWLASRFHDGIQVGGALGNYKMERFSIRVMKEKEIFAHDKLFNIIYQGSGDTDTFKAYKYGIRPCFTLKDELKIIGGTR